MPAYHSPVKSDRLIQFAFAHTPTLIIEAAIHHGIFDVLEKGAKSIESLSRATGTRIEQLRILLNALVSLDFLTQDKEARYALSPESAAFLVSTKPEFCGGLFQHTRVQLLPQWLEQTNAVCTSRSIAEVQAEAAVDSFLQPLVLQPFVNDRLPLSLRAAELLADQLNIAQTKAPLPVLDIAASAGVWGTAIAQQSVQVQVTAIDWAGVIELTRRNVDRAGLSDRFRYIEGDLLAVDFGSGYQLALLGHILHGEGRFFSRQLLGKVMQALAAGGRIAVALDAVALDESAAGLIDSDPTDAVGSALFAIEQLINPATEAAFSAIEISSWLTAAGFIDVRKTEAAGASPLILAAKPL